MQPTAPKVKNIYTRTLYKLNYQGINIKNFLKYGYTGHAVRYKYKNVQ